MDTRLVSFAGLLVVLGFTSPNLHAQKLAVGTPSKELTIEQLLVRVPADAAWQDLAPNLQTAFEEHAMSLLIQDRKSWGLNGLQRKADLLFSDPTAAMKENIDRILSITYASEAPRGFSMARDVKSADLRRALIRIYLSITDDRGYMLSNHPDFMGWDGMPVKELQLLDHEHDAAMAIWSRETEDALHRIPEGALSPLEKALRAKSYFATRAEKHFDSPALAVNGSMGGYSNLYALSPEKRPFTSDSALLSAYNASMFSTFREVNRGTADAFLYDYESEFNREWLKSQGMPETLVNNVLKLGNLFRTRVQALPDASLHCTIFSPSQRDENWDAFTARQISNADGSETMQSYAKLFEGTAARRLLGTQAIGRQTLERLFPDGSPDLTSEQRSRVVDKLMQETRPAMMMETLIVSLDQITGSSTASAKLKDAISKQPVVGGGYSAGQSVRDDDKARINDMWTKIRAFIKREYSGYRVDIAALIPAEPIIVTTGQNQFTVGGQVNLSLGTAWNLASYSSTMMHEIKHAIDQKSHAAVEGAAWEGAATSIERQVWPIFIEEAMAEQAVLLPVARLTTEIDNVRFTATTDATLKILLRESCNADESDTIAYAEQIVRNYGYSDPSILRLRSRRAHRSTQYLEYDYGLVMYSDLLAYLQNAIGSMPRVDAYLLQACALPSPKRDQATVDDLKGCIRDRKS